MRFKRALLALFSSIVVFTFLIVLAGAESSADGNIPVPYVFGRISYTIPQNATLALDATFSLEKGDTISYNCTYTPKSASLDFGFVAPDGLFYSLNSTSGSINKSIKVNQTGAYTLAIRNNESYAVTVTGTVKY